MAVADSLGTAVIIASLGRPDELAQLSVALKGQTVPPDRVIFSVTCEQDLPDRDQLVDGCDVVFGDKGLCAQRNRGLDLCRDDYDIIVFLDDDYLPTSSTIEGMRKFFNEHPDYVGVNGNLIADGINSGGIDYHQALEMIRQWEDRGDALDTTLLTDLDGLYGCNMAFRADAIGSNRFDESLPLYGWQEDIDFSARVGRGKHMGKTKAFAGIHRGVNRGRTSGVRLGYSQIANPIYLVRKGTMSLPFALKISIKNFIANHAKLMKPEPWIDRVGRAKGNWFAIGDFLLGKVEPSRMLEIEK